LGSVKFLLILVTKKNVYVVFYGKSEGRRTLGRLRCRWEHNIEVALNLLTPNVNYSGRTAPLTYKVAFYIFIQQI